MQHLFRQVKLQLNDSLCVKDPTSTEVGENILRESVNLIHEIGLEAFTFKKLSLSTGSTEATIYRYFSNKHQLLMYLSSWYWNFLEWKIAFSTSNSQTPQQALEQCIQVLVAPTKGERFNRLFDDTKLQEIVTLESTKAFVAKGLSKAEKKKYYSSYLQLIARIEQIIQEAHPKHTNATALATTILETVHYQHFLQHALPEIAITDKTGKSLSELLHQLLFTTFHETK
jgi:AcrR family transcriptional regulator